MQIDLDNLLVSDYHWCASFASAKVLHMIAITSSVFLNKDLEKIGTIWEQSKKTKKKIKKVHVCRRDESGVAWLSKKIIKFLHFKSTCIKPDTNVHKLRQPNYNLNPSPKKPFIEGRKQSELWWDTLDSTTHSIWAWRQCHNWAGMWNYYNYK